MIKLILIFIAILFSMLDVYAQQFAWSSLGTNNNNGTNGNVYAITTYNGNIVVAGGFTQAGTTSARNIAVWNGITWSALGSGVGISEDTVRALTVFNGDLIAAGSFNTAGGNNCSNIARWNGSSWQSLGSGVNGEVFALLVYGGNLIAGGEFDHAGGNDAESIARWNGSNWSQLGNGVSGSGSKVLALKQFGTDLIVAGRFTSPSSNIARWNGSNYFDVGGGIGNGSSRVFALTVWNGSLIAGGRFSIAGGNNFDNIARWNGTTWSSVGAPNDLAGSDVLALISYSGDLIVGGNFRFAGNLYVDRITRWNGTTWNRMVTGANQKVNALALKDTSLYAVGEFVSAGGSIVNHIGRWFNMATFSVSGQVRFSDNNQPVPGGKVKAVKLDTNSREVIVIDSAVIINGDYIIHNVINTPMRVIVFPDDELDGFVPTYYPSTVDWNNSVSIYPTGNMTNVNINVYRLTPLPQNPLNGTIGGHVYLNIGVPLGGTGNYPYKSDALVYFKQGSNYKSYSVSKTDETYISPSLPSGTYDMFVSRAGYTTASRIVILGSTNLDTINFNLNPSNPIGIHIIGTNVPESFSLAQNYPNPFNPVTKIKFTLPNSYNGSALRTVRLTVFDVLGQVAAQLINDRLQPGVYETDFDANNFPSGIYFYQLLTEDFAETKKMVLIK